MAWLAVDKSEMENIYDYKPLRNKEFHHWLMSQSEGNFIELPKGTIAKLLRHDMKWEDEPVELK